MLVCRAVLVLTLLAFGWTSPRQRFPHGFLFLRTTSTTSTTQRSTVGTTDGEQCIRHSDHDTVHVYSCPRPHDDPDKKYCCSGASLDGDECCADPGGRHDDRKDRQVKSDTSFYVAVVSVAVILGFTTVLLLCCFCPQCLVNKMLMERSPATRSNRVGQYPVHVPMGPIVRADQVGSASSSPALRQGVLPPWLDLPPPYSEYHKYPLVSSSAREEEATPNQFSAL